MESRMALSTSPTATTSTAPLMPINVKRRCLRVIACSSRSSCEPQALDHFLDAPKLVWIAGKRVACFGGGGLRLVALAEHHIGAQQPLPSVDIAAVFLETSGEPRDHAADHVAAVLLAHLRGGGDIGRARPRGGGSRSSIRRRLLDAGQRTPHGFGPRRVGRRLCQ